MELDNTDRRILYELEKNARTADVKLAKIVKKSKDSVRYRIKKLENEKIIFGYRTWVDYARIGYNSSTLTFQLLNLPDKREKLINEIRNDKRVSWLGIAEGAWNLQATYAYKTNQELFNIKNTLISKYQNLIIKIELTQLVGVFVHEKSFLINQQSKFMRFIDKIEPVVLDQESKQILKLLFLDSRINVASIATRVGTSVEIVRARMQKMEQQKVIVRYGADINYTKIGYDLYKASVYLKSSTSQDMSEIVKYAEQSDKIMHVVQQIAPWDLELVVFAKTFSDYNKFIADFTQKFSKQVRKVETAIMSEDLVLPAKKLIFE